MFLWINALFGADSQISYSILLTVRKQMSANKKLPIAIVITVLCILLFWGGSFVFGPGPSAKMMLDKNEINLGKVTGEGDISLSFPIRNAGDTPLLLQKDPDAIDSDCIEMADEFEIAPGDIVPVKFTVQKEKLAGEFRIEIPFISNDETNAEFNLVIFGERKGPNRFDHYGSPMHARLQRDF